MANTKSTWARNTVTGVMAEFKGDEYDAVDPNQWTIVEGYPIPKRTKPEPKEPTTPRAIAAAAIDQVGASAE